MTIVKKRRKNTSSELLDRNGMWVGAITLSFVAVVLEHDVSARWSKDAITSVAYLAIPGTVLTFTIYFWLLRHVAAYRMSMIAYITPVIAFSLGTLLDHEPLTAWTIGGSLTILAGVALVVAPQRAVNQ